MHHRTKQLAISKAVKGAVWERDGGRCILCLSPSAAPNAHYIRRSQGGLGIEQNVVTLCLDCHNKFDNSEHRPRLHEEIRTYLADHYPNWDEQKLYYRKESRYV